MNVGSGCNIEVKLPLRNQEFRNKRILFVGIDWERKGGPLLVKAFQRIREKHPDAQLTIIGCRPELNIANCHVMGKVPLERMPDFFQESSIFCFPSEVEPLGIALYEAALYGLGICSTRYEAAEEFLQHEKSVLFNELGDGETLYQNLLRLIENPELCRAYGAKAQSIAKARFDWTRVGDEMHEAILSRLGSQAALT
jgi:glycosyltransferase involved in cell wall biosynthesis